jgi:anti-anti-sigma regulatory factor
MDQEGYVFIGKYETTFIFKLEGRLRQKSLWNVKAAITKCEEDATVTNLLVDISQCEYMDSTILGMLARWAISFVKTHSSPPFLLGLRGNPLESTLRRMKLDSLFHVSEDTHITSKSALSQIALPDKFSRKEYAEYLLSAHQTLAELSSENAKEFAMVIDCLKAEVEKE